MYSLKYHKNAFQIIQFTCILNFYNYYVSVFFISFNVHTIEFVISGSLVAFTLQYFEYSDFSLKKDSKKGLQAPQSLPYHGAYAS